MHAAQAFEAALARPAPALAFGSAQRLLEAHRENSSAPASRSPSRRYTLALSRGAAVNHARPSARRTQSGSLEGAPAPWVTALQDAFPDVEWLDRDLDLGEGRSIDWVGIDASGRAVFALASDGMGEKPVMLAL